MTPRPADPVGVVKIGGSLVSDPLRLRAVLAGLADGTEGPVAIVPGGGPFADAVRIAQAALGLGDALAHRLALDAMGRMAEIFHDLEPRLSVAQGVEAVSAALTQGHAVIWDPIDLRAGHPGIAESWDVTSDSLALWLAAGLGAERCVLVKSAPCPPGASLDELVRSGIVDRAFAGFARSFGGVIAMCGADAVRGEATTISLSRAGPHPGVRGGAEPRRSPPAERAISGVLPRGGLAASQDEGEGGSGERPPGRHAAA